jgi:hypothetical protein
VVYHPDGFWAGVREEFKDLIFPFVALFKERDYPLAPTQIPYVLPSGEQVLLSIRERIHEVYTGDKEALAIYKKRRYQDQIFDHLTWWVLPMFKNLSAKELAEEWGLVKDPTYPAEYLQPYFRTYDLVWDGRTGRNVTDDPRIIWKPRLNTQSAKLTSCTLCSVA